MKPRISCVIRHHNPDRQLELKRSLFSLAGQTCDHIEAIVMLQRFTLPQIEQVKRIIQPLLSWRNDFVCKIINLEDGHQGDARTHLLNLGLKHASGRYVGFLDFDDTLYPEAYSMLTEQMRVDTAGIAFASVRIVRCNVHDDYVYSTSAQEGMFKGNNLAQLMSANFCPLHSYLIDREEVLHHGVRFDPGLNWEEDYDFLLQATAKMKSSFALIGCNIGDYYIKNDRSNSIGISGVEGTMSDDQKRLYDKVRARIELRRQITTIDSMVQQTLGLEKPQERLTIRQFLDSQKIGYS